MADARAMMRSWPARVDARARHGRGGRVGYGGHAHERRRRLGKRHREGRGFRMRGDGDGWDGRRFAHHRVQRQLLLLACSVGTDPGPARRDLEEGDRNRSGDRAGGEAERALRAARGHPLLPLAVNPDAADVASVYAIARGGRGNGVQPRVCAPAAGTRPSVGGPTGGVSRRRGCRLRMRMRDL